MNYHLARASGLEMTMASKKTKKKANAIRPKVEPPAQPVSFPVVGVGASAGGFEAFRELLEGLPADIGMAFVFVQHLDPTHESLLAPLLGRKSALPVTQVTDGMIVEANHVYVIPPNARMDIDDGKLKLMGR